MPPMLDGKTSVLIAEWRKPQQSRNLRKVIKQSFPYAICVLLQENNPSPNDRMGRPLPPRKSKFRVGSVNVELGASCVLIFLCSCIFLSCVVYVYVFFLEVVIVE